MSLWHYIDLAWDEMGVFGYFEPTRKLVALIDNAMNRLSSMAGDRDTKRHLSIQQIIEFEQKELLSIRSSVQMVLAWSKQPRKIIREGKAAFSGRAQDPGQIQPESGVAEAG